MAKNARNFEERPWGNFSVAHEEILSDGQTSIEKILTVYPSKRLSLQIHQMRSERWEVKSGHGTAQVGDEIIAIKQGDVVEIPVQTKHRLGNTSKQENLVIFEKTFGQFDEFDNERLEDDFNRDSNWRS